MATLRLIRHATVLIEYGGRRFLVDPMLSPKGALDPAAHSANAVRNPTVELRVPLSEVLDYEECLVTHAHRDHLDAAALAQLPKDRPVLCQPEDKAKLVAAAFAEVIPIVKDLQRGEISYARTVGEHGKGELIAKMGASSGFVLKHPAEPPLFLAGDTLRSQGFQLALKAHRPEAIVLHAGAAQFTEGGPVTMTIEDVLAVARECALARIVVTHLEAWNHCAMTRADLRSQLEDHGLTGRVLVPEDGETVDLA